MADEVRIRNGMSNATEGDILGNSGDSLENVGVVNFTGGHLAVTENSPKSMNVQVAGGIVYIENASYDELDSDTPKYYPVVCQPELLTITPNISGSTRIDIVCEKIDKIIVPNADASNIATKVVIAGTPGAGVPTTPANHYKLAEIEIINGETEIENSMITDTRNQISFIGDFIPDIPLSKIPQLPYSQILSTDRSGADNKIITGTPDTTNQGLTQWNSDGDIIDSGIKPSAINTGWIPLGETLVYVSVDDPTGVVKVVGKDITNKLSVGMKLKLTNGGNIIKAIITAIAFSTDTTITFLHEIDPTDSLALTLMANSAITLPYFSTQRAPYGFPMSRSKWSIILKDAASRNQASPSALTWYNLNSSYIDIPIGEWTGSICAYTGAEKATGDYLNSFITLSTANNSESNADYTSRFEVALDTFVIGSICKPLEMIMTSKTRHYVNTKTNTSSLTNIYRENLLLKLTCAYL